MEFDNIEQDDVVGDFEKKSAKKKINSKSKGDRTENQLCKLLTKHFGRVFSRALGSGSRWSQVSYMPSHAKETLSGDICCPEKFFWVIEAKGGYEDKIDLNGVVDDGITQLDIFIEQSTRDHLASGRKPIIVWKRSRKPWLAMVREQDLGAYRQSFSYVIDYREWIIVPFELLLKTTPVTYWFEE